MLRGPTLSRHYFLKMGLGAILAGLSDPVAKAAETEIVKDCRNRPVTLQPWRRIAVIGGTLTETLYALGVSDRIIGIDSTSTWPPEALKEKPSFGYMRTLSPEGILSLEPDLILSLNDAGPAATMDHLTASHIPVFFVEATASSAVVERRTKLLAHLMQKTLEGEQICQNIKAQWDILSRWRHNHPDNKKVLFILQVINARPLVAGRHTAAEQIINLAGGSLVTQKIEGYKILNSEAITDLKPDVILTMTQNEKSTKTLMAQDPAFRLTPAGQNNALIAMEGEQLLGFGPRTAQAALILAQALNRL